MSPDAPQPPAGPKRILLVEDDPELSGVLAEFLREKGWEIHAVTNGVEALKAVLERDYTVVLCDMVMPRMPGDMFYLAVRRVRPHLCDRFLFITAHEQAPRIREFLNTVSESVLRKPFHLDDLRRMIDRLLEARAAKQLANLEPAPDSTVPPAASWAG